MGERQIVALIERLAALVPEDLMERLARRARDASRTATTGSIRRRATHENSPKSTSASLPNHGFAGQPPSVSSPVQLSPGPRSDAPSTRRPGHHARRLSRSHTRCAVCTLLPRNLEISFEPTPDRVLPRTQHRQRHAQGSSVAAAPHPRSPDAPSGDAPMSISQPTDRRAITTLTTYLLKQLHPRHLPLPPRQASSQKPPRVGISAPGGAKSNERNSPKWGQIR